MKTINTLLKDDSKKLLNNNDYIITSQHPELRVMSCAYKKIELDSLIILNLENNELSQNQMLNLENDLEYLGTIGLRDNLQEGIQETIQFLKFNNKYVSVCAGDRKETASYFKGMSNYVESK